MKRVFVSYSRTNLDVVTQIVHDLQAVGIDCWYDQTLTGGQRWWDNILANIRDCDLFIFALSPESLDSEACRSELSYVTRLGKPILPVQVADGVNVNLLSPPLNEIQVTDYRGRNKEAGFALVKAIYTAPATPLLPEPLPLSPPVPVSYLSTLKEKIDAREPLSEQNQITLLFELEEDIRNGRSPVEIRDLLLRLKRRDDLLAKISVKIDAALQSLDNKGNSQAGEKEPNRKPLNQSIYCPKCGASAQTGQKFCASCGAPLAQVDNQNTIIPTSPGNDNIPMIEGSKCRRFTCNPTDSVRIVSDVKSWLGSEGFDAQQMSTDNQGILLQIKKRGGWRDFVGMSTSLNLVFHQSADTMTVQIGAGKWIDKAAVGTVSLFILWPLAITAGIGAWEQMKMPEKVFDFIGARLMQK